MRLLIRLLNPPLPPVLGLGDLPARSFEAGNSINGDFPCACGAEKSKFIAPTYVLKLGLFLNLQQRAEKLGTLASKDISKLEVMTKQAVDQCNTTNQQLIA